MPNIRLLWRLFKAAYFRWWTAVYAGAIGLYELAARLLPEEYALPELTTEALRWLALPLLFLAPFMIYARQHRKLLSLKQALRSQAMVSRKETATALFKIKFGSLADEPPQRRFDLLIGEFTRLEREIGRGDFSNGVEVLAIEEIMVETLRKHFAAGIGYAEWHYKLVRLIEDVNHHEKLLFALAEKDLEDDDL